MKAGDLIKFDQYIHVYEGLLIAYENKGRPFLCGEYFYTLLKDTPVLVLDVHVYKNDTYVKILNDGIIGWGHTKGRT